MRTHFLGSVACPQQRGSTVVVQTYVSLIHCTALHLLSSEVPSPLAVPAADVPADFFVFFFFAALGLLAEGGGRSPNMSSVFPKRSSSGLPLGFFGDDDDDVAEDVVAEGLSFLVFVLVTFLLPPPPLEVEEEGAAVALLLSSACWSFSTLLLLLVCGRGAEERSRWYIVGR